jgi:hypothetical protein
VREIDFRWFARKVFKNKDLLVKYSGIRSYLGFRTPVFASVGCGARFLPLTARIESARGVLPRFFQISLFKELILAGALCASPFMVGHLAGLSQGFFAGFYGETFHFFMGNH